MKPILTAIRNAKLQGLPSTKFRPLVTQRHYATQPNVGSSGAGSRRKAVTPFNDDGHVPWTELSGGEKTARAAQQTFNFGMVMVGIVLTGGVAYFLYSEVFSSDSKVSYFNRAVDRIKRDPRCLDLLGESKKITAYGEPTWNKWRRARPIASTATKDTKGNQHLRMHFNVKGPRNLGQVNMHLIKRAGGSNYEYEYFYLDVKGHQRIYLENSKAALQQASQQPKTKLFGIQWT